MDRIIGVNTIDLGGGRRGFRGKDTVAGIPGTELAATWHNEVQEELIALIEKSGQAPSGVNLLQILQGIRSQAYNYRGAAGTADAITIALDPAPAALAELLGVPLRILTGASANSAAVTLSVNGLAATAVRGADNLELLANELPANTIFEVAYNGAFFQIINRPVPAAQKAPAAFIMTPSSGQSIAASTQTVVNWFTPINNDTLDSTLAANQVTIGPKDAGWWVLVGKLFYDFPASGVMYSNVIIERNGSEISAGNAPGTTSVRARPQATAIYKFVAGDVVRLTTATDTARNLTITGGSSIFAGFKIGA
jgi:hypothetical protein